jgi:periplasmic copper chaperone A
VISGNEDYVGIWSDDNASGGRPSWRANSAGLATIPVRRQREYRRRPAVGRALIRRMLYLIRSHRLAVLLGFVLAASGTAVHALVVINQPWVKPAAAGRSTEAFMNLTSTEGATLVAARSESAAATTLHRPGRDARAAVELALPAGAIVELVPGRYRFSLRRLNKTIKLGDIVPMTLTIRSADGVLQDIAVRGVARLRSPVDDERRAHRHQH